MRAKPRFLKAPVTAPRKPEAATPKTDAATGKPAPAAVSETVTYLPGREDPPQVKWQGRIFRANTPKTVTDARLIEMARANRFFKVGPFDPSKDAVPTVEQLSAPNLPDQYRAHALRFPVVSRIADETSDAIGRQRLDEDGKDWRKRQLLYDLNEALAQYAFEASYEAKLTPKQFRRKFDALHSSLTRLKTALPSPRHDDRLFEAVRRHGEVYAKDHGPHPGLQSRPLPGISLPDLNEQDMEFQSSRRLRDLIEAVDQVERWMRCYDETVVPKTAWARLEIALDRSTRTSRVRLIGKGLPAIYEKHFDSLPHSASSSNRATGTRNYRPWVHFVCAVCEAAQIRTGSSVLSKATVEQYWKRMAKKNPFVMVQPIGPNWENTSD
jgi:hypothetical protein